MPTGDIVVCGGEKGGTGKTMLATNLAVSAARAGKRVKLIDADPQGSSSRWAGKRSAIDAPRLDPYIPHSILRDSLFHALREEARHYDAVFVDAGGADSMEFETAVAACSVLLSPVIPSDCDLATLLHIDGVVARLSGSMNRTIPSMVVLNHVSTHSANEEAEEAVIALGDLPHLIVSPTQIHTRRSFRDAFKQRRSVVECAEMGDTRERVKHAKAAAEILSLFQELQLLLGWIDP